MIAVSPLCEDLMEDAVRFIEYKGKEVLLIELMQGRRLPRPSPAEQIKELAKLVLDSVTREPHGSILLLADFTGAQLDKKAVEILKPILVLDRPYLKRSAWVGTENIPKTLYEHLKSFSRRDLPTFKTRKEAFEWLVSD
jgi:hypothetical protein